jgi:hypothetical protein
MRPRDQRGNVGQDRRPPGDQARMSGDANLYIDDQQRRVQITPLRPWITGQSTR